MQGVVVEQSKVVVGTPPRRRDAVIVAVLKCLGAP